MIDKKVIDSIYKKFNKRPSSPDELDIPLLFEKLPEEAKVEILGNELIINSTEPDSPFHNIPIGNINAIIEFDEAVAIILHASIIFISKDDGSVNVHIKELEESLFDRIKSLLTR